MRKRCIDAGVLAWITFGRRWGRRGEGEEERFIDAVFFSGL